MFKSEQNVSESGELNRQRNKLPYIACAVSTLNDEKRQTKPTNNTSGICCTTNQNGHFTTMDAAKPTWLAYLYLFFLVNADLVVDSSSSFFSRKAIRLIR